MEDNELRKFVQYIQNKVSIAVAVAVIQSKPSNLSLDEYVREVQEKCFQKWVKDKGSSVFDDKLLELQRVRTFNQLSELLTVEPSSGSSHSDSDSDVPDITAGFIWSGDEFLSENSSSDCEVENEETEGEKLARKMTFVEAMLHLKFAVESSDSLPESQVKKLILTKQVAEEEEEAPLSWMKCSEDSGLGDSGQLVPCKSKAISSSMVRFVSHSMKTEALIEKYMRAIRRHMKEEILKSAGEVFSAWEGSVIAETVRTLSKLSANPHVSSALFTLAIAIIDSALSPSQSLQLDALEYQLALATEFCVNKYIVEGVLKSLHEKLIVITKKVSEEEICREEALKELVIIERAPLLINLTSVLSERWFEMDRKEMKTKPMEVRGVKDLWRENTAPLSLGGNHSKPVVEQQPAVVVKIKEACEQLFTASSQSFPLLSLQAFQLLQHIEAQLQSS